MTSVTAYMLCEVLNEAGVPPGVVNMVFGLGPEVGQPLVEHEDVPLISFTGGTVTGRRIMASCAPLCKKVSLELGGKNPNIVFDDADLDQAVATSVKSSFANQGEICLCGSRIFVQEGVYDRFLERFVSEAGKLVVGDPADPATTTGALISKEHREKVESYIEIARQDGRMEELV
jgi:aminomuconate-semialdehyde dehydrogenase